MFGIALSSAILLIIGLSVSFIGIADAQNQQTLNPEQIERCNDLGIRLEDCNDQTILQKEGHRLPIIPNTQPQFDFIQTIGIVGAVIGISAAAVFIIMLRTRKKATNQTSSRES